MTTLFLCYALADREYASELARFLERGAPVRVFLEEGLITAGEDLVAKACEARTADIIVLVLSPASVDRKWPRTEWHQAFLSGPLEAGVRIAYLERAPCGFPAVLKREHYYTGRRALKRWVRTGERQAERPLPDGIEELAANLADRPGTATSPYADAFVEHCAADFDAVVWLRCGDRSLAQLAGELGMALGLKLDGPPLDSAERIRRFCHDQRLLLVLEDARTAEAMELVCDGETSTLLTEAPVRDYRPTGLAEIQYAFTEALCSDWNAACAQARRGLREAREQSRNAEAFEIMKALHRAAKIRGDESIKKEAAREQIWILEHWGRLSEANRLREDVGDHPASQMALEF